MNSCVTCKYENFNGEEHPCNECGSDCNMYKNCNSIIDNTIKNENPQKPLSETYGYAGEVPYTKYMCPTGCCKIAIHRERDNYCPNCGQAIDWSVEG